MREQYTIEEDKEYIVGRSEMCDIVFPNCENVSKRHCRLTFDSKSKQFCIEDFSTNGTYVNYVRLEKETKYYAGPQDLIILANTRFVSTPVDAEVYGGELANSQVLYWELHDKQLQLRSMIYRVEVNEENSIVKALSGKFNGTRVTS